MTVKTTATFRLHHEGAVVHRGEVITVDAQYGAELIRGRLAVEYSKAITSHDNKMMPAPDNKAMPGKQEELGVRAQSKTNEEVRKTSEQHNQGHHNAEDKKK